MVDYGKMSKAELFKKYGPFIKENYGKEELDFVKDFSTGPGGLDSLRSYIISLDPEPVKKYAGGLISKKKYMNPVKIIDKIKKKK